MARLPSWTAHQKGAPSGDELLNQADALVELLHAAIEDSWRTGRAPSRPAVTRIRDAVVQLRTLAPPAVQQQLMGEEPEQ